MSNIHDNQKHTDKLLLQLKAFVKKFDKAIPVVLKEFKLSFSNMPGDLSKLYNNIHELEKHVHAESHDIMEAVEKNQLQGIPVTVKSITTELWSVDEEAEKLKHKYTENSLLQAAVQHFHKLHSELKKALSTIVNATSNLENKVNRMPEGKYHNHTLGFRVSEERVLNKKAKSGAF